MTRRFVLATAVAVAATAFLPGSGLGSSAAAVRGARTAIPAGLAAAIHARLGAGAIRSGSVALPPVGPFFGYSVSLSGDGTTALVGAPLVNNLAGAAYIFHVSDAGSWTSTATPTATLTHAPRAIEVFGYKVALSADGTTAFVGAPAAGGANNSPGAIYVFHVSTEDAWASSSTPAATLTVANGTYFGIGKLALSSDGTTLLAGVPDFNDDGPGTAYVFHASGEATWTSTSTPAAKLQNAVSSSDTSFGYAVAISGDGTTALVGDFDNAGGAYIFRVAAENLWTNSTVPTATLSDANATQDFLGHDVALSGDGTVAVVDGENLVDVFHTAAEAAWVSTSTPTAALTKPGTGFGNAVFGLSLALSTDGTTALVTGIEKKHGASYTFHVADEGSWVSSSTPGATLTDSSIPDHDLIAGLSFGVLSADGATALVGAPYSHFETGAADVFHASDASSWATTSTPTASLSVAALARCVVPNLRRLTVADAKAALKVRSCRLGKVGRVQSRAKKGHVVSQSQRPNRRLRVGTKVNVKVAK